jgi:plastocyanin
MNLKARFWLLGLALVSAVILSACGSTGGGGGGGGGGAVSVNMLDTLKFDPATISVGAGGSVNVKNGGAQQHNFVLVKPEDENRVATEAAAKNGDATGIAGVLAGGAPVAGGGTETVTLSAPAGSYSYICTIPGHYQAGMKGTLTVQ